MTTPPVLATRVRKARRSGQCSLCPAPVLVSQPIGLITAGWAHVQCIVQAAAAAAKESA